MNELSERGRVVYSAPPVPHMPALMRAWKDPYAQIVSPDGHFDLAVAENKLYAREFCQRMVEVQQKRMYSDELDSAAEHFAGYVDLHGHPVYRTVVARFLSRRFSLQERSLHADHIVLTAGAASALSGIINCLLDPGDVVLLPSPAYSAFDVDVGTIPDTEIVYIPTKWQENYRLTIAMLDDAMLACKGKTVRALLLTNPNNPLATCIPADEMIAIVSWCQKQKVHLIVDEIYAFSSFYDANDKAGSIVPFTSVIQLLNGNLGNHVHVVWGLSKDFCASGFRIGVLVTHLKSLYNAMATVCMAGGSSAWTLHSCIPLLDDDGWVDSFLQRSAEGLRANYMSVTGFLQKRSIPFIEARAAMFIWIDLRKFLPEEKSKDPAADVFATERSLFNSLMKDAKCVLTPGESQHADEPGFFRLCYAGYRNRDLLVALDRLDTFFRVNARIHSN